MYDLDKIRAGLSLIDLAEEAGAVFQGAGRLLSPCPLPRHAGDRSSHAFNIYENGKKWKCHSSCPPDANGGDIFAFYMAWKGVDFKTAVKELASRIGAEPTPKSKVLPRVPRQIPEQNTIWRKKALHFIRMAEKNLAESKKARAYLLKERGLSEKTWRAYHLGYNPRNLYEEPEKWGLTGKKIWLPRGIVISGMKADFPNYLKIRRPLPEDRLGKHIPS